MELGGSQPVLVASPHAYLDARLASRRQLGAIPCNRSNHDRHRNATLTRRSSLMLPLGGYIGLSSRQSERASLFIFELQDSPVAWSSAREGDQHEEVARKIQRELHEQIVENQRA